MMVTPPELFCGVALDMALGDPRWMPHPVQGIGRVAAHAEEFWRRCRIPLRLAGSLAWLCVVGGFCFLVYASLKVLPSPWIQIYWIYALIAVRGLDDHAAIVVTNLRSNDLRTARESVAMMVGRDADRLNEDEITRAVFESVAESLNDGIIAPLFWLGLGGPVAMAAHKAVNTLDSMWGHRNERYNSFGWAAARMDDLANFAPSRITAVLIWTVATIQPGLNARNSLKITMRDARNQPSPNSGYPEAAVAGALGVQLGGVNFYQGKPVRKAFLGDPLLPLQWNRYRSLRAIVYSTTALFVLLLGGIGAWR